MVTESAELQVAECGPSIRRVKGLPEIARDREIDRWREGERE